MVLLVVMISLFNRSGREFSPPLEVTAAITVLADPATSTPTLMPTAASTPTATSAAPPPEGGGEISVGGYVEIFGTEGDGLRIRSLPGTDSNVLFLGLESEVFYVIDGPDEQDGYVWWHIQAPYDETVEGWAASNFLRTIENQ